MNTIQINHQLDTKISPLYYLTVVYSSTYFGRPHARHQELNKCSSSLWFYLQNVVIAVLLVVVGPRPTALLPPRSSGKPEAATAVVELLMMGMRMPETCWAVFKRQAINLRNYCIWLVESFESPQDFRHQEGDIEQVPDWGSTRIGCNDTEFGGHGDLAAGICGLVYTTSVIVWRKTQFLSVVKFTQLTLRRLMSYIYGAPILDVSRSHTTTQHSR